MAVDSRISESRVVLRIKLLEKGADCFDGIDKKIRGDDSELPPDARFTSLQGKGWCRARLVVDEYSGTYSVLERITRNGKGYIASVVFYGSEISPKSKQKVVDDFENVLRKYFEVG